jgi:hypothetical protein
VAKMARTEEGSISLVALNFLPINKVKRGISMDKKVNVVEITSNFDLGELIIQQQSFG